MRLALPRLKDFKLYRWWQGGRWVRFEGEWWQVGARGYVWTGASSFHWTYLGIEAREDYGA